MQSLETRVHGLELALDEISYDLAVSNGRMTNSDVPRNTCCLLPGAEFLSSKFWRKTQGQYTSSPFSRRRGAPSLAAMHYPAGRNIETRFTSQRLRLNGDFITNPLAEVHTNSRDFAWSEPILKRRFAFCLWTRHSLRNIAHVSATLWLVIPTNWCIIQLILVCLFCSCIFFTFLQMCCTI